ncbi:MAG: hypothetical protein FJ395_19290 [Verrucomicrobia bacterium]|nr:hypothetical protein [Verrucomicrobiota bacterium]
MASSLRQSSGAPINFFSFIDIITGVTGVLILVTLLLATKVNPQLAGGGLPEDQPDPVVRQRLNELLDQLSVLNLQNQQLQQTLAAVQAAPSVASLQQEVADLRKQAEAARQRAAALQDELNIFHQRQRERDSRLGLDDISRQIEKLQADLRNLREKVQTTIAEMMQWEAKVREAEARLLQTQRDQNKLWVIPEPSRTSKEPLLVVVSDHTVSVDRFNKPESRTVLQLPSERELLRALKEFSIVDYYIVFYVRPSGVARFGDLKNACKKEGYEVGYDAIEEQTEILFSKPK